MAILLGTQANGETLPVQVNEFGQLVAQGIDGTPGTPGVEGPPGPPGIGQLPPDPFEGAVLGWEDGELVWIGVSVPLPLGTYGPFVYDFFAGTLTVPQDVNQLINGQQLIQTDALGNQTTTQITTDLISNVGSVSDWNQSAVWSSQTTNGGRTDLPPSLIFNANTTDFCASGNGSSIDFTPAAPLSGALEIQANNQAVLNDFNRLTVTSDENNISRIQAKPYPEWTNCGQQTNVTRIQLNSENAAGGSTMYRIRLNGKYLIDQGVNGSSGSFPLLSFPTFSNFDVFSVGDVVQLPDVKILEIDDRWKQITVNGGTWQGTDFSGSPGGQTSLTKLQSGAGSVLTATGGVIVLRSDNGEWSDGMWVTSPEQRIAARKIASTNIRKKKK